MTVHDREQFKVDMCLTPKICVCLGYKSSFNTVRACRASVLVGFVHFYIGRVFPFFATPKLGRELNKELEKFAFAITFTQRKKGKDLPVWKTYENACFVGFSG